MFYLATIMPATKVSLAVKLRKWIEGHDSLTTDGEIIFCKACDLKINASRSHHVKQHLETPSHLGKLKRKCAVPKQTLLKGTCEKLSADSFKRELCEAMIAANIPWFKLNNPVLKAFLEKYMQRKMPEESTLRKNYLQPCYDSVSRPTFFTYTLHCVTHEISLHLSI